MIVTILKGSVITMSLNLSMCCRQCYDGVVDDNWVLKAIECHAEVLWSVHTAETCVGDRVGVFHVAD